jgi:hypothetical protein
MHRPIAVLAVTVAVIACPVHAQDKQPELAGWMGVFPQLKGYARKFQPAVVEGDKKNPIYRQTAEYEWTGGADRNYAVTLARNVEFKKIYSEEEVKKTTPAPEKVEVAKHTAWLWKFERDDKKEGRPLRAKLVVLLGEDRILIIEVRGLGPFEEAARIAEQFDFKKIAEALEQPPLIGSRKTVEVFRQLKKGMSYADAAAWVGPAEKDIGSGIHIMVYTLDDDSTVVLGFADFNKMMYAKHRGKDGKTTDLVD